jgi:hypothetical protein
MANLSTQVSASLVIPSGTTPTSVLPGLVDPTTSALTQSSGLIYNDFTGSKRNELFWQNSKTGDTGIWEFNSDGSVKPIYTGNVPISSGWEVVGFADLTGDGQTDILWENKASGDIGYWKFDAAGAVTPTLLGNIGSSSPWQVQGFFNDGGKAGIYWKDTSATDPAKIYGEWHLDAAGALGSTNYIPGPLSPVPTPTPKGGQVASNLNGSAPYDAYSAASGQLQAIINNGSAAPTTLSVGPNRTEYPDWDIVDLGAYDGTGETLPMFKSSTGDYGYWKVTVASGVASISPVNLATGVDSGWQIVSSGIAEYQTLAIS